MRRAMNGPQFRVDTVARHHSTNAAGPLPRIASPRFVGSVRFCIKALLDARGIRDVHRRVCVAVKDDHGPSWRACIAPCAPFCSGVSPAFHGGERGRQIVRTSGRKTRMHTGCSVELRICVNHNGRHGAARRHASDVDARRIDVVGRDDFTRDACDQRRLAALAMLIVGLEPVPALRRIGLPRLHRISNEASMPLGKRIHLRAPREIIRVLRATVQHHDQRKWVAGIPRRAHRADIDGGRQHSNKRAC